MQVYIVRGDEQRINKVIGLFSKAFNTSERKYSTTERELAAIRFCIKAFRAFFLLSEVCITYGSSTLVYLQRMKVVDSRIVRALEVLTRWYTYIKTIWGSFLQPSLYLYRV